ncbi:MAG: GNAT family N-acetyltransferase [Flavobacteriales bacterium]|nr:GNAT family N-acetyltransferase [Flavobacteriales bacterium]
MTKQTLQIRKGSPEDVPVLLALIKDLADYERAPDEVIVTEEQLMSDGFGERPFFHLLVAELNEEVIGIALYYFAYSTWKGKYLYLEDFIVQEAHRGQGYGKALFDAVVENAKSEKVKRMGWQVLDWNEPAIEFYKRYNADLSDEWLNGRLYFE